MPYCEEHSRVTADLERLQKWVGDVQGELRGHCNGGGDHVRRRELDELKKDVETVTTDHQNTKTDLALMKQRVQGWAAVGAIIGGLGTALVLAAIQKLLGL